MRRSYSFLLSSLIATTACATGETIDEANNYVYGDASVGGSQTGEGGAGGGGAASTGGSISNGGSGSVPTGGVQATGGSKATGGATANGGTGGGKATGGGGSSATGGAKATGGTTGSTGGKAGSGGSTSCTPTEKFCNGVCTPPAPAIGCSLTDCSSCPNPAPANGVLACKGTACGFNCNAGFKVEGSGCVPMSGTGGAGNGGSTSTGGATGAQCVPRNCPDCGPVLGPSCCTQQNKCGCPIFYIPGTCS